MRFKEAHPYEGLNNRCILVKILEKTLGFGRLESSKMTQEEFISFVTE